MMATTIVMTGTAVDIIPSPTPEMMTVAGPVLELSASLRVGLYECEVKYSVDWPMMMPAIRPTITEHEIHAQLGIPRR